MKSSRDKAIEFAAQRLRSRVAISNDWSLAVMHSIFNEMEKEGYFVSAASEIATKEVWEICAKVCDDLRHPDYSAESEDWIAGTMACAAAIRALSLTPPAQEK